QQQRPISLVEVQRLESSVDEMIGRLVGVQAHDRWLLAAAVRCLSGTARRLRKRASRSESTAAAAALLAPPPSPSWQPQPPPWPPWHLPLSHFAPSAQSASALQDVLQLPRIHR